MTGRNHQRELPMTHAKPELTHDKFEMTAEEARYADIILHNDYRREPTPNLYAAVRGCAVNRLGYWTLADRRGQAIYGHA